MKTTIFRSALTGICSGAFQGATGVGGSIIMVSALSSKWGLKLSQIKSAATALPTQVVGNTTSAAVLIASLTEGYSEKSAKSTESVSADSDFDLANVVAIALPATISVAIGTRIGSRLSDTALKFVFGVALTGIAPMILHKAYKGKSIPETQRNGDTPVLRNREGLSTISMVKVLSLSDMYDSLKSRAHFALAGTVMGFVTGLVGVGGGPIIISYLSLQTDRELSARQIVGTANLSMLPMMMVGTLSHAVQGNIVWRAAAPLCVATMAGGAIGGIAAAYAPTQLLQTVLAAFLVFTGYSTSSKALRLLWR